MTRAEGVPVRVGRLRHRRELPDPPFVQLLDSQPVGGEQLVQRPAADLRGEPSVVVFIPAKSASSSRLR
ncbi:MAG TPA: hypothetical protein VI011_09640 [Asanoa sp.]